MTLETGSAKTRLQSDDFVQGRFDAGVQLGAITKHRVEVIQICVGERLSLGKPVDVAGAAFAGYPVGERDDLSLPREVDAYQAYRAGERTAGAGVSSAWLLYRRGEWGR